MQREFSKELAEDRQFEIGGELFQFRYPHWSETAELFDEEVTPRRTGTARRSSPSRPTPSSRSSASRSSSIPRTTPTSASRRSSHARPIPVPRHQIVQLYRWLLQVTSGLPTNPPSDSESGGGDSAESSEGGSS